MCFKTLQVLFTVVTYCLNLEASTAERTTDDELAAAPARTMPREEAKTDAVDAMLTRNRRYLTDEEFSKLEGIFIQDLKRFSVFEILVEGGLLTGTQVLAVDTAQANFIRSFMDIADTRKESRAPLPKRS